MSSPVWEGEPLLELLVTDDAALDRVRQQHFSRLQPGSLQDMGRVDVQHPNLGGQDEPAVVGEVIPGGAQAVAVQHRASDSAMLDNTLEFLVMSGMELPLAVMVCVPEPWMNDPNL